MKIFLVLIFACSISCFGQSKPSIASSSPEAAKTLAELIDSVRPSVVQIAVKISGGPAPKEYAGCFNPPVPICVVGTGFFVNSMGYAVTALHVMDGYSSIDEAGKVTIHPGVKEVLAAAERIGTHAQLVIGVSLPNVENPAITLISSIQGFPAKVIATDPGHDIAVIQSTGDPFRDTPNSIGGNRSIGIPKSNAKFVNLSTSRPRDGDEVFACGYPFQSFSLVSTSGKVASAWNERPLLRATAAGFSTPVEVYELDLGINPGNSGGPVFKASDQSVLGVAVEAVGSLGIAVPAKFLTQLLDANKITWYSSEINQKSSSGKP